MPTKPIDFPDRLEVAVTHTREAFGAELVREFFEKRWIMTGTAGEGPDCSKASAKRRRECEWWNHLRMHGGAVIANYEGCFEPTQRLIGWVEKDKPWIRRASPTGAEPLYGLQLTNARLIDRETERFENLRSGRRSLGACHELANGRLWAAVQAGGPPLPSGVPLVATERPVLRRQLAARLT